LLCSETFGFEVALSLGFKNRHQPGAPVILPLLIRFRLANLRVARRSPFLLPLIIDLNGAIHFVFFALRGSPGAVRKTKHNFSIPNIEFA
jgi:hypothetical protein